MEVESTYPKYTGRVPPLDLTQLSVLCDNDNELHTLWASKLMCPSTQKRTMQHSRYSDHLRLGGYSIRSKYLNLSVNNHFLGDDGLPLDPRDWTRSDVWKWLISMSISEGLEVTPELPKKFPMNGKALCLMSLDMYLSRVPVGGKMLYRDFRVRLARAMAALS